MTTQQLESRQKDKFQLIFDLFDKDSKNILTTRELGTIMRFLG